MSRASECNACIWGNHAEHVRDWNITPGVIGGEYCPCLGECETTPEAERAAAERLLRAIFGDGEVKP